MLILKTISECQNWRTKHPSGINASIGFVPTMGALHSGHQSLIHQSLAENSNTVVSIFVNPTQFDQAADLNSYPQSLEDDLKLLGEMNVDAVFLPDAEQMYADKYRYKITESELSKRFCGSSREGHFDGVLTVVMRLFNLIQPSHAYFGENDWQQLELIRGMVAAFFMPIQVISVSTLREPDGLAISSRNQRLSSSERELAPQLQRILKSAASANMAQQQLKEAGFRVDYVTDALFETQTRRLAAADLGSTRLIDNIPLNTSSEGLTNE